MHTPFIKDLAILGTIYSLTSIVIVPSRVHLGRGKGEFEAKGGKNPNFREMKRERRKRGFGRIKPDNCRNQVLDGTDKGIFARFQQQNKQKNERQLCIKVSVQR